MKTWISYLAAIILGLAATLLFGESVVFQNVMYTITAVLVQIGAFVLIPLVFFGFSSGIASLRKDSKGGVFTRTTILWSILSTLVPVALAFAVFRFFPTYFPNSTSAGSDPSHYMGLAGVSLSSLLDSLLPGNPFYTIASVESYLLPMLLVALILGFFLKPNLEVIRPAYVVMNSLSETMFRIARAFTTVGHLFVFCASVYWFTSLQNEGTIFVAARFLIMLLAPTLVFLLIILPLLFGLVTRFKVNPYAVLYRMLAVPAAALFTGSIFFTSPINMSLTRHNLGCQKRVSATAIPLYTLIGRGGSAMIAALSVLGLLFAATGTIPSDKVMLFVCLASAGVSFASPLYLGNEVVFIAVLTLQVLKIDLYGAQMTMLALMPLLNGLGILLDSYIAAFGTVYTCQRMGVLSISAYRDIL